MRGAVSQAVRADRHRRPEVHRTGGYRGHADALGVGHGEGDARPLQVVVGVAVAALHGAWVVDADGVVPRREVGGEIRQQRP